MPPKSSYPSPFAGLSVFFCLNQSNFFFSLFSFQNPKTICSAITETENSICGTSTGCSPLNPSLTRSYTNPASLLQMRISSIFLPAPRTSRQAGVDPQLGQRIVPLPKRSSSFSRYCSGLIPRLHAKYSATCCARRTNTLSAFATSAWIFSRTGLAFRQRRIRLRRKKLFFRQNQRANRLGYRHYHLPMDHPLKKNLLRLIQPLIHRHLSATADPPGRKSSACIADSCT